MLDPIAVALCLFLVQYMPMAGIAGKLDRLNQDNGGENG